MITYWNLADALFPDGVFKKLWAGIFVTSGGGCEKFEKKLCEMYERVAVSGKPDAAATELLTERSPSAVADRIKVPSLLVQGQSDSLFPLGHADSMQKAISANGAPVSVDWISGGHDGGDSETARVEGRVGSWFDRYLKEETGTDTGPAFRVTRTGGIDSTDGAALKRGASSDTYPGLRSGGREIPLRATGGGGASAGTGSGTETGAGAEAGAGTEAEAGAGTGTGSGTATKPTGSAETFRNPAGAVPPAISAVPGVGGGLSQLSSLGVGLSLDFPGQFGRFESAPLATPSTSPAHPPSA
ncbi:hypothetical protein Smic_25160 [Streptomyces microflavus]|uniref:Uncharacterized protein n=1 Tax=Streptomyces microflavus TaxID=1919 RepID=A0A7J0CN91_STRMI|nr:hypothetical protein Smic_25160 [Streptomyces microflavus]